MKKFISMTLAIIMLLCMIPTTTVFAAKEEVISQLDLTVPSPKEGEKPSYDQIDGRGYYSDNGLQGTSTRIFKNGIAWFKSSTSYFSPGTTATFEGGKTYTVKINLLPKGNFSFAANVSAKINGKNATVEAYDDGSILVTANLTSDVQAPKTLISSVDLTVVKPVIGKTPTFAKVDTDMYLSEKYGTVSNCSNGVTWTNQSSGVNLTVNNPFKEGVKYKVTYYLTAKDGYKFSSSTRCTINGTAATLEVKDETHIAVSLSNLVPGDGKREINSLDLSITAPAEGAKPAYNKIDGTGYYSDNGLNGTSTRIYKNGIAWYKSSTSFISPGTTETFEGGKAYTVKISLIPKDGYKFGKNISVKINGKTATVETFDDGSINVSVTLTATKKDHVHTASTTWQTDLDNHWKICTDKNCGSLVGEKQKHSDSNKDGKCDVCGYNLPVVVPDNTTTTTTNKADDTAKPDKNPTKPATNNDESVDVENTENITPDDTTEPTENINVDDNNNDNKNSVWLILGVILVLAAGAVVVVVLMKKKKDNK